MILKSFIELVEHFRSQPRFMLAVVAELPGGNGEAYLAISGRDAIRDFQATVKSGTYKTVLLIRRAVVMAQWEVAPVVAQSEALDAEYSTWADNLPAANDDEVELCECGCELGEHGDAHPDCQCCEACGHYPCNCQRDDDSDDSLLDSRWYGWVKR